MRLLLRALPILTLLSIFSIDVFAQGNPGGPGVCFPPPCVPVSDHIGWLIGAALLFGIFKAVQYSRNSIKS